MGFQGLKETSCAGPGNRCSRLKRSAFYFPLHEAAISGNSNVVRYILSEAQFAGLKEKLLFETLSARRGLTVIEIMGKRFARFEGLFDTWLVKRVVERMKQFASLPDGVHYKLALVHYILTSASGKLLRHSKVERWSKTPLDKW
jgi:hypothetical protein